MQRCLGAWAVVLLSLAWTGCGEQVAPVPVAPLPARVISPPPKVVALNDTPGQENGSSEQSNGAGEQGSEPKRPLPPAGNNSQPVRPIAPGKAPTTQGAVEVVAQQPRPSQATLLQRLREEPAKPLENPFQTFTPILDSTEIPGYLAIVTVEHAGKSRQLPALLVKQDPKLSYLVVPISPELAPQLGLLGEVGDKPAPAKYSVRWGDGPPVAADHLSFLPYSSRLVLSTASAGAPKPLTADPNPKPVADQVVRLYGLASDGRPEPAFTRVTSLV